MIQHMKVWHRLLGHNEASISMSGGNHPQVIIYDDASLGIQFTLNVIKTFHARIEGGYIQYTGTIALK